MSAAQKHTPQWDARRVNEASQPWAVINPNGEFGDEFVAAFIRDEKTARLIAAAPEMLEALEQFANCDLNDGNCASLEVATKRIRNLARLALAKATDARREERINAEE